MKQPLQLHIPTPCHESWDHMSPTEQGRHCMSCNKEVIDFSLMSDKEILAHISKASNNICGRVADDQLGRTIQSPAERKNYSFKYFWSVLITSSLISNKSSAQVKPLKDSIVATSTNLSDVVVVGKLAVGEPSQTNVKITGRVVDEDYNAVSYASVVLAGTNKGVSTDSAGYFSLTVKKYNRHAMLEISSVGFEKRVVHLVNESQTDYTDDQTQLVVKDILLKKSFMGEVVVTSKNYSHRLGLLMTVSSIRYSYFDKIKDTLTGKRPIKVYPNPINRNSVFSIEFNLKETGEYALQCVDANGRVVHTRMLNIAYTNQLENFSGSMFGAEGTYFINVRSKQSAKMFTTKLLVQ